MKSHLSGNSANWRGRMLLKALRGEETDHDVVVPTQLVIRGSTAPPRA